VEPHLTAEAPYQLVMIGAFVELLLLGALVPRAAGVAPLCFEIIAGLRLALLLALAVMLGARPEPPTVSGALGALLLWGALLAPPELWAFALEARSGLPVTALSSVALAGGLYAALRLHRTAGWTFLALVVGALTLQGWSLEPLRAGLSAVIALAVALLVWVAWRERSIG
jgi:hypothetical protein